MNKLVENYLLHEPIGKGVYGTVYRAIHQKNKQQFAIKVIPKAVFQANPKLQQLAINEIKILSSLKNPHIIKFIETLKTPNNFYFVYEYCNGGALDALLARKKTLKESEALRILGQLLQAFKQLNKNSVMHRDLKPDNIFLADNNVKLGDFGFCKFLEVNMAQTMLGSPIYMAPEILKEQIYTSKADIWSLGVVLFQMLYGYCPFQSNSIYQLINVLKQTQLVIPDEPTDVSEATKQLLKKMLIKDQFKRIEWVDLFEYKIDDDGKMICPSKKDYSIENLENYFLFNHNVTHNITQTPPQTPPQSEAEIYKAPTQQSPHKNSNKNELSNASKQLSKQTPESSQASSIATPYSNKSYQHKPASGSGATAFNNSALNQFPTLPVSKPHKNNQQLNQINITSTNTIDNYKNLNINLSQKAQLRHTYSPSTGRPTFISNADHQRKKQELNQTSILQMESPTIKSKQLQSKHSKWNQAIDLMLELSQSSNEQDHVIVYWMIVSLFKKVNKQFPNHPQWADVLSQEKNLIVDSLKQWNEDFKVMKEIYDGKNEVLKLWKRINMHHENLGQYNSESLERAIRFMYASDQNQGCTVEQLLLR